jgi:hypothetical protein
MAKKKEDVLEIAFETLLKGDELSVELDEKTDAELADLLEAHVLANESLLTPKYYLIEAAIGRLRYVESKCRIPPPGWSCSRAAGHEGPCAARRVSESGDGGSG